MRFLVLLLFLASFLDVGDFSDGRSPIFTGSNGSTIFAGGATPAGDFTFDRDNATFSEIERYNKTDHRQTHHDSANISRMEWLNDDQFGTTGSYLPFGGERVIVKRKVPNHPGLLHPSEKSTIDKNKTDNVGNKPGFLEKAVDVHEMSDHKTQTPPKPHDDKHGYKMYGHESDLQAESTTVEAESTTSGPSTITNVPATLTDIPATSKDVPAATWESYNATAGQIPFRRRKMTTEAQIKLGRPETTTAINHKMQTPPKPHENKRGYKMHRHESDSQAESTTVEAESTTSGPSTITNVPATFTDISATSKDVPAATWEIYNVTAGHIPFRRRKMTTEAQIKLRRPETTTAINHKMQTPPKPHEDKRGYKMHRHESNLQAESATGGLSTITNVPAAFIDITATSKDVPAATSTYENYNATDGQIPFRRRKMTTVAQHIKLKRRRTTTAVNLLATDATRNQSEMVIPKIAERDSKPKFAIDDDRQIPSQGQQSFNTSETPSTTYHPFRRRRPTPRTTNPEMAQTTTTPQSVAQLARLDWWRNRHSTAPHSNATTHGDTTSKLSTSDDSSTTSTAGSTTFPAGNTTSAAGNTTSGGTTSAGGSTSYLPDNSISIVKDRKALYDKFVGVDEDQPSANNHGQCKEKSGKSCMECASAGDNCHYHFENKRCFFNEEIHANRQYECLERVFISMDFTKSLIALAAALILSILFFVGIVCIAIFIPSGKETAIPSSARNYESQVPIYMPSAPRHLSSVQPKTPSEVITFADSSLQGRKSDTLTQ